jgi:peroxiredoxin
VPFVGVAWTGSDEAFQGFIDKYSLSFPTISDDPGDVFTHFGVPSQPAWVMVDAAGEAEMLSGAVEPELLDSILTNISGG